MLASQALSHIAAFPTFGELVLFGGLEIPSATFAVLSTLSQLTALNLSDGNLNNESLATLCSRMIRLNSLRLVQQLNLTALRGIENLFRLTLLNVAGCVNLSDSGIRPVTSLSNLQDLDIVCCVFHSDLSVCPLTLCGFLS